MEIDNILPDVISWARQAGAIQMTYFRTDRLNTRAKLNDSDIVTAADAACEAFITAAIRDRFPDHSIISEESGATIVEGSDWEWVIDPLDGTTNFASGLPLFGISIALRHKGVTELGVVFAPYLDELFHAVRGEGAMLNGRPVGCRREKKLERCVVATGFPVDKATNADNNLDNVGRVLPRVRGLRRLGSAAIDLCYVAAGFLDGYWELNLHEWDVAAGELIISEAGGRTVRFRPDTEERHVCLLAAQPEVFDELLTLVK